MKIALISDIHGNFNALNAVLEDIHKQNVDKILCLGDIATLGPQPTEVIKKIKSLDCLCIMGNHEMALLNPGEESKYEIPSRLSSTLQWCRERLSNIDFTFLKTFENCKSVELGNKKTVLCYHASPSSYVENIRPITPVEILGQIFNNHSADIMAGGHTHIQMQRRYNNSLLVNPGSVGCSFMGVPKKSESPKLLTSAEYAIIQFDGKIIDVDLRQIPFDIKNFKDVLIQSDVPTKEWWLEQY